MKYSISLLLDEKSQHQLQILVNSLAASYQAPAFEPHLTLIGGQELEKNVIIEAAKHMAFFLKPRAQLTIESVEFSTTFWRCIYLHVKPSVPLVQAHVAGREFLHLTDDYFGFIPHISLMYGNYDVETRAVIANEIELPFITCQAEMIYVYEDSSDPEQWYHLAEFKL